MLKIDGLKLPVDYGEEQLRAAVAKILGSESFDKIRLLRKSLDARKNDNIRYVLSVAVSFHGDEAKKCKGKNITLYTKKEYVPVTTPYDGKYRPVVVGTGPAGLFAALSLAKRGANPLILEQGKKVDEREKDIEAFFQNGLFSPKSNIQFGEGGAGTFSDGKLNTGTKDLRHAFILETFAAAGAPSEILYMAKPHIGSDYLPKVVKNLRQTIESLGGEFRFSTKLTDIVTENGALTKILVENPTGRETIPADRLLLAVGHSARDTYEMLYNHGVEMTPKGFSLGVRIEHLQSEINETQYGTNALGAADYKLAVHLPNGRSAYTFCMCPGGTVVGAASEEKGVVTNGMSLFSRDGRNANSALLVGISPDDFPSDHPLAGIALQRELEKKAYLAGGGNYAAPCQRVEDFFADRPTVALGKVKPTYLPKVTLGSVADCLPKIVVESLKEALPLLEKRLHGFSDGDALLTAVETRSSAPVRIQRDDTCQSNIQGIYPCGEGSGYAGGIMSSAADGIRCSEFL